MACPGFHFCEKQGNGPATRPCPGEQHPWARPWCLPADPGRRDAEFCGVLRPDLLSWMEPCSLPAEGGASSLISEFGSGAGGQRALLAPPCSVLWNSDPACGMVSVHPNTACVGAPARAPNLLPRWLEVTPKARCCVPVGFHRAVEILQCSPVCSTNPIKRFQFCSLLTMGAALSAEVQHY